MPEGLSATEVGKEIGEHARHAGRARPHDRAIAIGEALLLSIVTIVAAWSGYSAAKWGTESSLALAEASTTRTKANREFQESLTFRVGDATTFNAWFDAYLAEDQEAVEVAERRSGPSSGSPSTRGSPPTPSRIPMRRRGRRQCPSTFRPA